MTVSFGGGAQSLEVTRLPQIVSQAATYQQYIADGVNQEYDIPFPYISTTHVRVDVNGAKLLPNQFEWVSASRIRILQKPLVGQLIEVRRETEVGSLLVQFQNGAVLTEQELNLATKQNFYLIQETRDLWALRLGMALSSISAGNGTITVSPAELINAVTQDILGSELLAELNQRISDIDLNAEALLNLSTRIDGLDEVVNFLGTETASLSTLILNETEERIEGDAALAGDLSFLGAKSPDGLSWLLDMDTVKVDATTSIGSRLSALQSSIDDNRATILAEQTARAEADSALASDITTLQTTVNGHTTAIQTNAESIDGIQGKYTVKIDNNGYVSGYGLISTANNGVPTSEFIVLADRFAVVTPGGSPTVPFVVSGGVTYLQNVVVGSTVRQGQTDFDTGVGFWLGNHGGTPKFSLGNSAGNKVTWNGSTLSVTGSINMTNASATFSPTWSGFSSAPVGTLTYLDLGAVVFLWAPNTLTGTSNATTMSFTGLPVAIRPSGGRWASCQVVNNGSVAEGACFLNSSGTVTFYRVTAAGPSQPYGVIPASDAFNSTGSKGIPNGFLIIYPK